MKLKVTNITLSLIGLITFLLMIKIDNESRLPQNIDTDYYMNSLPHIYVILFIFVVLILINLVSMLKKKVAN